jgi:multidrug efflux pump subunit AcrB
MVMARQMPIKGIHGMRAADMIVKVRGQDMLLLEDLARQVTVMMKEINQFQNVSVSMDLSKPEYQVLVDRTKAAELGIPVSEVAGTLRTLITGTAASRFKEGSEYYDIRVVVPEKFLTNRLDVENLTIAGTDGQIFRLRDIAEIRAATGPVEIIREDQIKQISVEANIAGGDLAGAAGRLRQALSRISRPPGYEFDFGGSADMMADMKDTVFAVLGFAIFFSFIVLAVQFNSFKLPALILGCLPVCLGGTVFLMHATGLPLGATVIIGVLVIVAVTVNDGVLLLAYARDIQNQQSLSPRRAVVDAAKIRLRPRIMTSVTTMIGFFPLALNLAEGGDMLQPMAWAAIGGLAMEILVALFLMPCLYVMVEKKTAD